MAPNRNSTVWYQPRGCDSGWEDIHTCKLLPLLMFNVFVAACIALVDEMKLKIGNVDKKSTVQVGSFRIDSSGNQKLYEV